MTTIAPPLQAPSLRRVRSSRHRTVAARGALSLLAVIALTVPAHLSLQGQVTESATIAAATGFAAASLLSLVAAASIWHLARARAAHSAIASVITLTIASLLHLYASLTLLWHGTTALADFREQSATAFAVLGIHLLATAVLTMRLRVAPVATAALLLTGVGTLAAVFPPGWHPMTTDALVTLSAGQAVLIGWMGTQARPR